MFKQLWIGLLSRLWNKYHSLQVPVSYERTPTDNDYLSHKTLSGGLVALFHVTQLKIVRKPRFPFYSRTVYMYQIDLYLSRGNEILNTRTDILPEMCWPLYRFTKIPHVVAINAYIALEPTLGV